jgi:hypothetical protein
MRTSPTYTNDPPGLIPSAWANDYGLIDVNTHVLSPMITTNLGVLKPYMVTANLEANATIEAVN